MRKSPSIGPLRTTSTESISHSPPLLTQPRYKLTRTRQAFSALTPWYSMTAARTVARSPSISTTTFDVWCCVYCKAPSTVRARCVSSFRPDLVRGLAEQARHVDPNGLGEERAEGVEVAVVLGVGK